VAAGELACWFELLNKIGCRTFGIAWNHWKLPLVLRPL